MKDGIKPLIAKLDRVFSIWIRQRDADENGICTCITCGAKHHWKNMDCGHFIKRQYMSTRFSEVNCHAQCRRDNWLEQGADVKYREAIIKKYGQETLDLLMYQKNQTKKWTRFELEQLIKKYSL